MKVLVLSLMTTAASLLCAIQPAAAHPLHFDKILQATNQPLTPSIVATGLVTAFFFGAGHALSPGHGKTLVAAYLVGSQGTAKHALWLGFITTVAHTIGVFCLGLVALFAAQYWLPEQIYPILSLLSGVIICGIGFWLLDERLASTADHHHGHHHHGHHHHGHHHHEHAKAGETTLRSLTTLGIAGGLIPCPSALVLLLSAIALHKTAYGILLLVTFSLGLAFVLTVVGLTVVYSHTQLNQLFQNRLAAKLPIVSAIGVIVIGVTLTATVVA